VWGSEVTSKDATLQGESRINCFWAERKIVDFGGGGGGGGGHELRLFSQMLFSNLFGPSRTISNLRPKKFHGNFDSAALIE
jgi:hypothetical protein